MHYYQVCKRKLWLFSRGITMEQTSDRVLQGKVLHEQSFKKKRKEFNIDDLIQIDLIDSEYVGEVKSSSKMKQADYMQLLYYLFYLKQYGIERKGRIHYVKEKKVEELTLTQKREEEIEKCLVDIRRIVQMDTPPKKKRLPYCSKCAYYPFCFAGELE